MKDNEMFILLRESLLEEYEKRSLLIPEIRKAFQPENIGIPTQPTIYLHKISDYRVGSPGVREEMDKGRGVMREITTQVMLATFQISATVLTDDDDPLALTASDLLKSAATVFQSRSFQRKALTAGANILRVGNIPGVDVSSDYAGREIQPFFELTLNHQDITIIDTSFITRTESGIKRI